MTDNLKRKKGRAQGEGGFVSGIAVLTAATVIVKLIGVLYKIPMIKYLGEEGMGYFNSAYEIYTLFFIIATAGLPVAISILVAKNVERGNVENVRRVYGVSLAVLSILGVVGSVLLIFGASLFGDLIGNSGASLSILAIAPMALLVCVSSAVRGYFQGWRNMVPTAVSQVIEALGKLMLGLMLAVWAINSGYSVREAAAFATLGITIGVGLSMCYLLLTKLFIRERWVKIADHPPRDSRGCIAKRLAKIAVPITVSSAVISLTRVIDMVMILRRLQSIGYTEAAANSVYGSYSTLAVSMFNLPASLVTPIALALVPTLTAAIGSGDKKREEASLNASLKLCGIVIIPAAIGMSAFSRPILELVFSGETAAINDAAPLLSVLAISVFFSCLITVTNAVLQAYGKERKPILSMLIGSAVKIILSYLMIGNLHINIYGAPVSTLACDFAVALANVYHIKKSTRCMKGFWELFGKTLLSAAFSVGACAFGYYFLLGAGVIEPSPAVTVGSIALAAASYLLLSVRIGAISKDDILLLPRGERLYSIAKKIRIIK